MEDYEYCTKYWYYWAKVKRRTFPEEVSGVFLTHFT